ncbi:MAG: hypothetical protein WBI17_12930 [Clostridiaceae bacterium]
MFSNIGSKIKGLALVVGVGGAILCALGAMLSAGEAYSAILVFGAILCIIGSWPLYGFGQLIESVMSIEEMMKPSNISKYR